MSIKWRCYRWYSHTSPQLRNSRKIRYNIQQALKQCCKTRDLEVGKILHETVTSQGLHSDVFLTNTLIEMYRKCGQMKLAQEVFETTPQKNAVTWTCMVLGYVENGESSMALELFTVMDCQPDYITCLTALKACTNVVTVNKSRRREILSKGISIHERIKLQGYVSDLCLMNTLVDLYSKCRDVERARFVFDGMVSRSVVSWNCLILGYVRNGENTQALEVFTEMDCEPDGVTYTAVVKAYTALASEKRTEAELKALLQRSSVIHEEVKALGLDSDMFLASALVDMYSKLREMKLARAVFESMVRKDVVTWNNLIRGYITNGEYIEALDLFSRMECVPNHVTWTAALKACTALAGREESDKAAVLQKGLEIHCLIRGSSVCSDSQVTLSLIEMYSRLGRMNLAKDVLDQTNCRDVSLWNALLMGYVDNGNNLRAVDMFKRMDCQPDTLSYAAMIKACVSLASSDRSLALEVASAIRCRVEDGLGLTATVGNMLVDMYCKCGNMGLARDVFERIVRKSVASWNSLILGYVRNGKSDLGLEVFERMECRPSAVTYVAALKACTELSSRDLAEGLSKGVAVHERAKGDGLELELYVGSSLIDMYSGLGEMRTARDVFERMPWKDNVTWACLMLGYIRNGDHVGALEMFSCMDCEPCHVTFVAAIKACSGLASESEVEVLEKALGIHREVVAAGFGSNSLVTSSLITMYSKLQSLELAKEVFDKAVEKDTVTWTSLICGYLENGQSSTALELFHSMDTKPDHVVVTAAIKACGNLASEAHDSKKKLEFLEKGVTIHEQVKAYGYDTDAAVCNTLVDMYGKCGNMKLARETFERMKLKDVVSWTCLVLGYVENDQSLVALEVFHKEDCPHDQITYIGALSACGKLASLPLGRAIHSEVCKRGLEENVVVGTALIDFYRRCGCLDAAAVTFYGLCSPNMVSWNSLIAGYAAVGDSSRVFHLAGDIDEAGLERDAITSVCILAACSHTGLVDQGKSYCESLKRQHVEHYNCLIDMLGRANRIDEAVMLARKMDPLTNLVTWNTLLGASKIGNNVEAGKVAFERLVCGDKTEDGK